MIAERTCGIGLEKRLEILALEATHTPKLACRLMNGYQRQVFLLPDRR